MTFRSLRLLALLSLSVATIAMAEPRRRAVRIPAPECSYALSSSIPDPVADVGISRAPVQVTPTTAGCTSWAAFSEADWISVESDTSAAYVTVQSNPTPALRNAFVRIAGMQLNVTQAAQSGPVSPPSGELLANGHFDTDLAHWGWQDRFPNGSGDVSWSNLDVDGSSSSGSIRLRDDLTSGPAYQQLQCIAATPGTYDYGMAVRADSRTAVRGIIAILQFDTPDCSGAYGAYPTKIIQVATPGTWERHTYTQTLAADKKAFLIVIGSWARESGLQTTWIDDVFLKVH